jgi:hypothetical protein
MSRTFVAAALVWWVAAIGLHNSQEAIEPLLDLPEELPIAGIMCFGSPTNAGL